MVTPPAVDVLTPSDLDESAALYVAVFGATPWDEAWPVDVARARLADLLATPRAVALGVRESDGLLLGFVVGHLQRTVDGDQLWVQEMCVRTDRQRAGLGGLLLEELARRNPAVRSWMLLTLREGPAADFYTRHGFRPARRIGVFLRP